VTDMDKKGMTSNAGYEKDRLERPDAAVQRWANMKRKDRRNEAKQQERSRMTSASETSGTTSRDVGPTT
jgi:hypothetical protein